MIVVAAPYALTETTAAAVRLAELAESLGHAVRFVSCAVYRRGTHPLWDGRVVVGRRPEALARLAARARVVVHFRCGPSWHAAGLDVRRPRQFLVVGRHGLTPQELAAADRFDRLVCPDRECYRLLADAVCGGDRGEAVRRLLYCRWDAGLPPVRREGTVSDGRLRALVFCDAATVDLYGPFVLQLAHELLAGHPRLDVTLAHAAVWPRRDRRVLRRLVALWPGRLAASRLADLTAFDRAAHGHDWVVLPSVRSDFGVFAARALACGAPVVCHDLPPYNEFVTADCGVPVRCVVRPGPAGDPLASPDLGEWLHACAAAFRDSALLLRLQTREWWLEGRTAAFGNVWRPLLAA